VCACTHTARAPSGKLGRCCSGCTSEHSQLHGLGSKGHEHSLDQGLVHSWDQKGSYKAGFKGAHTQLGSRVQTQPYAWPGIERAHAVKCMARNHKGTHTAGIKGSYTAKHMTWDQKGTCNQIHGRTRGGRVCRRQALHSLRSITQQTSSRQIRQELKPVQAQARLQVGVRLSAAWQSSSHT